MGQATEIPEVVTTKKRSRRIFHRAIAAISERIRYRYRLRKWSHHADLRTIDWDWARTNYNRIAVVNQLVSNYSDPNYLEIGCAANTLFDSLPVRRKTGVDPFFGGSVRKTSDKFFADNTERFDVVFIDGLHTHEQVRRDIINSLLVVNKGGWIALHDMLPRNWVEQHIPFLGMGPWTGDVWKVAFELADTEGIEFKILKIDHGVGVVRLVDPETALLTDLSRNLADKGFSYFYENIGRLPIVDWEEGRAWLRS